MNVFESAMTMMKGSISDGPFSKTAKDPLGAATLATFFGKSGQKIRMTDGVKYEAELLKGNADTSNKVITNDFKIPNLL